MLYLCKRDKKRHDESRLARFLSAPNGSRPALGHAARDRIGLGHGMGRIILCCLFAFATIALIPGNSLALEPHTETVYQEQWPKYVNGTNLLAMPQVSNVLRRFEEKDGVSITIQHPGTDAGRNWGLTLGKWLVSFGIPEKYLRLIPEPGVSTQLILTLNDSPESQ